MTSGVVPAAFAEPVWQPRHRCAPFRLPEKYRPWLLDRGSLTQRLVSVCAGKFRVEVIAQRWVRPMRNESRALGLRPDRCARVREVLLRCDDTVLVYARTVIPCATLSGGTRRLAHLRTRSLGAFLFADRTRQRSETEIARLTSRDTLYARAARALPAPPAELWGRRARFTLRGKSLLVSEIFLPAIPDFPRVNKIARNASAMCRMHKCREGQGWPRATSPPSPRVKGSCA